MLMRIQLWLLHPIHIDQTRHSKSKEHLLDQTRHQNPDNASYGACHHDTGASHEHASWLLGMCLRRNVHYTG